MSEKNATPITKEEAVKKINKIGKVGYIFAIIAKVTTIIGIVGCVIGMISLLLIPKGAIKLSLGATSNVVIDASKLVATISGNDVELEQKILGATLAEASFQENGTLEIDDQTYTISNVSVEGSEIHVSADAGIKEVDVRKAWVVVFSALLTCVAGLVTVTFVKKLCKGFRDCETPFEDGIIKSMRQIAFSLIPWAILGDLTNCISQEVLYSSKNISVTPNGSVVLAILLIFALAFIFKYGAMLQTESDETL